MGVKTIWGESKGERRFFLNAALDVRGVPGQTYDLVTRRTMVWPVRQEREIRGLTAAEKLPFEPVDNAPAFVGE